MSVSTGAILVAMTWSLQPIGRPSSSRSDAGVMIVAQIKSQLQCMHEFPDHNVVWLASSCIEATAGKKTIHELCNLHTQPI
jgi:hypothetical protein